MLLGWVNCGPHHGNGAKQCESGYPAVTVNRIVVDKFKRTVDETIKMTFFLLIK